MSNSEEKLHKGFSIPFAVLCLIIYLVGMFTSFVFVASAGDKAWTLMGWFIPPIYIMVLVGILGRVSPKLRLNPAQWLLLLTPLWFIAGKPFFASGGGAEFIHYLCWYGTPATLWAGICARPEYAEYLKILPSWFMPSDPEIITPAWQGLALGQSINWGAWIGPIVSWSLIYIALAISNLSIVFLFTGPHFTEVEHLVFPLAVPGIYLIETASSWEDSKPKLLSFSGMHKAFWIAFIFGLVVALAPIMAEVIPPLRVASGLWGEQSFDITGYTRQLLPGAAFGITFIYLQAILCILLPYEYLVTALYTWLIVCVIYNVAVVKLGIIPYSGGEWDGWPYGIRPPLPYKEWAMAGFLFALGVYQLWLMRNRVKMFFSALKGRDYRVRDLSMRVVAWVFLISTLIYIIMWMAVGLNPIMAIICYLFIFLWYLASARIWNGYWWFQADIYNAYWHLWYPIGAGLGVWGWAPPQKNLSLLVSNVMLKSIMNDRDTPHGVGQLGFLYKMAYELKVSFKEIYLWTVFAFILLYPTLFTINTWFLHHYGFANMATSGPGVNWQIPVIMNSGVTQFTQGWNPELNFGIVWLGALVGLILFFGGMYLKTVFPWFMFEPAAIPMTLGFTQFMWFSSIVSLIFKYLLNRVLGVKRTEELIVPIATGVSVGFGAPYLISALLIIFNVSIPNLQIYFH